jgi:hypothetical protein
MTAIFKPEGPLFSHQRTWPIIRASFINSVQMAFNSLGLRGRQLG